MQPSRSALAATLLLPAISLAAPGHEFWAALSEPEVSNIGFSVVASNPDPTSAAMVTIETETGVIDSASIPPLGSHEFQLGFGRKVPRTALVRMGYRVRSDLPVHAHQFLGFDARGTTGGSLLLDASRLGREYLVLAWPGQSGLDFKPSVVMVVAAGPTRVTVVPSAAVMAGVNVPALPAGAPYAADLDAFDVLQLAGEDGADLTGTTVSADAPVEVFAGCNACYVGSSAADEVQELMIPTSWWGTTVVAAASNPFTNDRNRWRILASADDTTVTTEPAMPGTPANLDRGQFLDYESTSDHHVSATSPILVARLNSLGISGGPNPDPAMTIMLSRPNFARSATFPLPLKEYNWVDIIAESGTSVMVDGVAVPAGSFLPVGSSGLSHAQVPLAHAATGHRIEADRPIAAYAGNASGAVSTSFPVDITPPDLAPTCDAGGPYTASCAGPTTDVPLSAAASRDPEGGALTVLWSTSSPAVVFDDPASASPTATVAGIGNHDVELLVDDGVNRVTCATTIDVTGDPTVPAEVSRAAAPLLMTKSGADIYFSWQDLGGSPIVYNVYEGVLKSFYTEAPLTCGLPGVATVPGRRDAVLTPAAGDRYFYVSASSCGGEGPTGGDQALATCLP